MQARYYILILLLLISRISFSNVAQCGSDSEENVVGTADFVQKKLQCAGLRRGYNADSKRIVAVATMSKEMDVGLEGASFDKMRSELMKLAILEAKRDVLLRLDRQVTGSDSTNVSLDESSCQIAISVMRCFSSVESLGCRVLYSAEAWNPKQSIYEVSVAVGWSERTQAKSLQLRSSPLSVCDTVDDEDLDWMEWFANNDLSVMIGPRQFSDREGHTRFVGIGAVDIEGLAGGKLRLAMRKAALDAVGHLAFSVSSDMTARTVATRYLKEIEEHGYSERVSWAKFASEVILKSSIKMAAHEVFSCERVHPITGHRMHISVYGLVSE